MISEKKSIFAALCLGCITISFNVAAIVAALPAISADLNIPDIAVSKIIPAYMIPYGVGALIFAPLTRFLSFRMILSCSMLFYAGACYACAVNNSITQFIVGRIGMGIAGASAIPLGLILIGNLFDKKVRGRLVGLFFGCSFIASIVGIGVSATGQWRWLFYIPAVLGVVTALFFVLVRSELLKTSHGVPVNYLKAFADRGIARVFIFIFVISLLYHGVHKWFGVYLSREYGLDSAGISFFIVLTAVSGFIGQTIGGFLTDTRGRLSSCYIGLFVLSIATMLLFRTYSLICVAVVFSAIAMGWTIGHNGISTILTDFPDTRRAEIASLNSSVRFVSGGIGFQISSLFVEKSFGLTFLVFGLCMLCSSVFLKYILPQQK